MAKTKKVTTTVTTTVTTEEIKTPINEKTHIICILDRSGSMAGIMSDSIGGFNEFLKKQKELPDEATITIALFDDKYELLYDNVNIKNAELLTSKVWYPRGTTALYDAIGKTINKDKAMLNALGVEKPSKVLVVVVTDGHENASREYVREGIQSLIKTCENEDWNFMYLAANQDAFAVGSTFGISKGNTFTYTANSDGVAFMSATLNNATSYYRGMSVSEPQFQMMSKSLISDDKSNAVDPNNITINDPSIKLVDGSLNISTTGNVGFAVANPSTTLDIGSVTYKTVPYDNTIVYNGSTTAVPADSDVIGNAKENK